MNQHCKKSVFRRGRLKKKPAQVTVLSRFLQADRYFDALRFSWRFYCA